MKKVDNRADKFVECILAECRKEEYTIGEVQDIAWGIQRAVDEINEIKRPKSYRVLEKIREEIF